MSETHEKTCAKRDSNPHDHFQGLRILSPTRQGVHRPAQLFTAAQAGVSKGGSCSPVGASQASARAYVRPSWHQDGTGAVDRWCPWPRSHAASPALVQARVAR